MRLVLRQDQFAEPRTRDGTEQADVVCDLEQICGERIERAMREHQSAVRRERLGICSAR